MQFDPLSDAFVRMYNAEQAGHYEVSLAPASKLLDNMLKIMQVSGYVGEYERVANGRGDPSALNSSVPSTAVVSLSHDTVSSAQNSISGSPAIYLPVTSVC